MNILRGKIWHNYLLKHNSRNIEYLKLYKLTYKYIQVYKIGEYYFCFNLLMGFKNLSTLKKNITRYNF